jgi:integrase
VPTLAEFVDKFLDGHARANRQKASGITAKESIIRVHLVPLFGTRRLDAITTEHVQQLKTRLAARKAKTVNNTLTVLNTLLKKAVEWSVIDRMPCTIRLLAVPKPTMGFYDLDEYRRLLDAAKALSTLTHVIVLLGGDAGLRLGEIIGLEWKDVDLTRRQVCVQRSEWRGHVSVPKGGRSRYVPLTARLTAALRDLRHLKGPRVGCQPDGSALTQWMVRDFVEQAAHRAGLETSGVHRLRHTFCSHLAMRGAPARAIQELAGHQDLMTTQRYMHLSPAALESSIRLLEELENPGRAGRHSDQRGDISETKGGESAKSL